jgi:small subunit ribosomal protein S1
MVEEQEKEPQPNHEGEYAPEEGGEDTRQDAVPTEVTPDEGPDESMDRGGEEPSQEEMMRLYEESLQSVGEGEIVGGEIIKIDEKEAVVDIGYKSEGVISLAEFQNPEEVKVGDKIEVLLEETEDQDGLVVLSKQKADFLKVWDRIKDASDSKAIVGGKVLRRVKGGVIVDLFGVDAFLPGSQIDLRPVRDMEKLMGKELEFRIIKLNRRRRNIVVSRRLILEQDREEKRRTLLIELEVGQIREGAVKNITDFGAFIDLGGIDGLLHITDMSWGRVSHPSEVVSIGDTVRVKVIDVDRDRERISLGLKQLTAYPWDDVDEKYPVGSKVHGRVVSITDYGAFVELEKGVEGLVHVSEMSWTQHIRHPSKIVSVGDEIDAMVLNIDKENERISLGLKQMEPDPWLTLDERYPVGTQISGKVRNLTNFGAFVEIEEGIDGLVHISDMSWTRRVKHPSEVVKKGSKVEVVVLNIDKENRRVSLGLKQLGEDPWQSIAEEYPEGTVMSGVIVKLLERGVVVDVGDDLEGFVPFSQLARPEMRKPAEAYHENEELMLKVIEVSAKSRRIVLSEKACLKELSQEEVEEYMKRARGPREVVAEPRAGGPVEEEVRVDATMALAGSGVREVGAAGETPEAAEETAEAEAREAPSGEEAAVPPGEEAAVLPAEEAVGPPTEEAAVEVPAPKEAPAEEALVAEGAREEETEERPPAAEAAPAEPVPDEGEESEEARKGGTTLTKYSDAGLMLEEEVEEED